MYNTLETTLYLEQRSVSQFLKLYIYVVLFSTLVRIPKTYLFVYFITSQLDTIFIFKTTFKYADYIII